MIAPDMKMWILELGDSPETHDPLNEYRFNSAFYSIKFDSIILIENMQTANECL